LEANAAMLGKRGWGTAPNEAELAAGFCFPFLSFPVFFFPFPFPFLLFRFVSFSKAFQLARVRDKKETRSAYIVL